MGAIKAVNVKIRLVVATFAMLLLTNTSHALLLCKISGFSTSVTPNSTGGCNPDTIRFNEKQTNGTYLVKCGSCNNGTAKVTLNNKGCYQFVTGTTCAIPDLPADPSVAID